MARFDPVIQQVGALANTEYQARPATSIRNGAVAGNQLLTLGGTINTAPQPFSITYTRVTDNYSWVVTGILMLTPTQRTLLQATRALATNLGYYHDVIANVNGANLTMVPKDASVTAVLAFLPGATLTLATSVVTNSTAPRIYQPGDVVGFSVDPASGEKLIVPVGSADFSAINAGVVLRPLMEINPMRAENVTYDVLVRGTVWMQLFGATPLVPATTAIQIGHPASTTPGKISVTGATASQFTTVNLYAANGTLSKFKIIDKNVAVGQRFRLELI